MPSGGDQRADLSLVSFALQAENIDVQDIGLQVGQDLFRLGRVAVVGGNQRVAAQPAMRGQFALLCAGITIRSRSGQELPLHVAGLAGGHRILYVEGKRRLFGERGRLPLVVDRERTEPLVIVQLARQGGFVAAGTKLRSFVEILHHRLGVAVEVRQDLGVGDRARDGLVVFIHQHGRHAHNVAARAAGRDLLDGVADRAGDSVRIVGVIGRLTGGQLAGKNGDRVMAALAVPHGLCTLFGLEQLDVALVPGGAVGV